jgi:hypothetical protein
MMSPGLWHDGEGWHMVSTSENTHRDAAHWVRRRMTSSVEVARRRDDVGCSATRVRMHERKRASRPRTMASAGRVAPSAMRNPRGVVRKQSVITLASWLRISWRLAMQPTSREGYRQAALMSIPYVATDYTMAFWRLVVLVGGRPWLLQRRARRACCWRAFVNHFW